MTEPEVVIGSGSALIALLSLGFKFLRGLDRRLRRLELGMTRIETHLGVDKRDSLVKVSLPPDSD